MENVGRFSKVSFFTVHVIVTVKETIMCIESLNYLNMSSTHVCKLHLEFFRLTIKLGKYMHKNIGAFRSS